MAEQAMEETEGEVAEEIIEEQPDEVTEQPDPEVAETARKYGWRPKEEYDLDPEGWVDADRFLELGSTQRKIVQDQNKELTQRLDESKKEFQQRIDRLERANKAAREQALELQKQQYEDKIRSITQKQREAVETADTDTWDALEREKTDVLKRAPKMEPDHEPQGPDPVVLEYRENNDWAKDPVLWNMAYQVIEANKEQAYKLDAKGQLDLAENHMRKYYPHLFPAKETGGDTPKPKRQMVDGGGLAPRGGDKGVNALPPEAVKVGKEFVEQGLFKNLEAYAKSYFKED